jgi:3-phenylpropionate/trans-cinnamate dioxygenase ferredoxin reductase subunit
VAPAGTIVVVGAGLTGGTAAATLIEEGFEGRLVMIGEESLPPYERPPLSKTYLRGEETFDDLFVRQPEWWEEHGIEARFGERVDVLDAGERAVILAGGERVAFDKALVATGVRNRTAASTPGAELDGVYQLRTVADADRIRSAAAGSARVAVVGMGFIGAEVAASLRTLGLNVAVVDPSPTPLYRVLGPELGRVIEHVHRDKGVEMVLEDTVERFEGEERVERVITKAGRSLECDMVVVGIGTLPNAEVMHGAAVGSTGGIDVDATCETALPGIFAAGDIAAHDHPVFGRVRIEHFDNAIKMGVHVGRRMLGKADVFDDPHWFWSDQYEHELQMGGFAPTWHRMVVRGSIDERRFCAFLLDEAGILRASVSFDWPRDCRRSLPLIRKRVAPDPVALADPEVDLRRMARDDVREEV